MSVAMNRAAEVARTTASITMPRAEFLRAADLALTAVSKRNVLRVLEGLRLAVLDTGGIKLSGADGEMQVDVITEGDARTGEATASVLSGPHAAVEAIRQIEADALTICFLDGDAIEITAGDLHLTAQGLAATEWPDCTPKIGSEALWTATLGEDAIKALARVLPAASSEQTRYYLNGVHLAAGSAGDPWGYAAIATDGHRLFQAPLVLPVAGGILPPNVIIPHGAVRTLLRLVRQHPQEPVSLRLLPGQKRNAAGMIEVLEGTAVWIEFRLGRLLLRARLIDGTYPNWRRVVPARSPFGTTFDRAELARAARAGSVGTRGPEPALKITFAGEGATIERDLVFCASKLSIKVACQTSLSPDAPFAAGINGRYLSDILKAWPGAKQISLGFAADEFTAEQHGRHAADGPSRHPITVTSPDDPTLRVIQMPMRV